MKVFDHRAIPSARHVNELGRAVNQLHQISISFDGGEALPSISAKLVYQMLNIFPDHFVCTGTLGSPESNGWRVAKDFLPVYTLSGGTTGEYWSGALALSRGWSGHVFLSKQSFHQNGIPHPTHAGRDYRNLPRDFFFIGTPARPAFMFGGPTFKAGVFSLDADAVEFTGHFFGIDDTHSDEARPKVLFPWDYNETDTPPNWDQGESCANPSDPLNPFREWGEIGFSAGHVEELGGYEEHPLVLNDLGLFGQGLGCYTELGGEGPVPQPSAVMNITPTPLGTNEFFKKIPDACVIESVMLEVKPVDFVRLDIMITQAGPFEPQIYSSTTSNETANMILMGAILDESGLPRSECLAGALGGDMKPDVWNTIDATDLFVALHTQYRGDDAHYVFGLVPAAIAEDVFGEADHKEFLKSMRGYWEPNYYEGDDENYIGDGDSDPGFIWYSEISGSSIGYTGMEIGRAHIKYRYPDGARAMLVIPMGNLPPQD